MSTAYTFDDRLCNWARWRIRNMMGGGNFATVALAERVDGGTGWDAPQVIRNDEADAAEIDRAYQVQPQEVREIIGMHYLVNKPLRVKLDTVGLSKTRFYEVLGMARRRLEAEVAQRRNQADVAQREERARIAQVMAQAR